MKRRNKPKGTTQARLTTAVTTSAMSLALLGAIQEVAHAQGPPPPQGPPQAQPAAPPTGQLTDEQAATKFLNFGYNYCDAKVLASFWSQRDPYEAKVTMGHKLWSFEKGDIDELIRDARAQALQKADDQLPVWIDDGGYTYNDAELLARQWGQSGAGESKVTISRLLIGGHDNVIKAALNSARRP